MYTGTVVIILNLYGYFCHREFFINQNCVAPFHSKVQSTESFIFKLLVKRSFGLFGHLKAL
jgi:hypothetical protein